MPVSQWPRLFVAVDLAADAPVDLDRAQAHYLRAVMRCRPGDDLRLFNGRDGEWQARVVRLDRNGGLAGTAARMRAQVAEPGPTMLFAPLKRGPVDYLVEKATELGVAAFQPVATARTVVPRLKDERLAAVAREAAEQCERLSVPKIAAVRPLAALARWWPDERPLVVCAEGGPAAPLPQVLAGLGAAARGEGGGILVGPEGGFEKYELDVLNELPFVAFAGLGPRILRAETAAVAALTCWQAMLGDWDQRPPERD